MTYISGAGSRLLNQMARSATIHCLTGCGIGEVVGMVVGTVGILSNHTTVILSIVLAFFFGYLLTSIPLLRSGISLRRVLVLALASDTISIAIMEVVDNAVMLLIPGAMAATLAAPIFWLSLVLSLAIAGLVAFPVVRLLIARGKGHAVIHEAHSPSIGSHSINIDLRGMPRQKNGFPYVRSN